MKLVNDRQSAAITEDLIHSKTNFLKNFAKVSSPYFVLHTINLGTSLDLNDKTWGTFLRRVNWSKIIQTQIV